MDPMGFNTNKERIRFVFGASRSQSLGCLVSAPFGTAKVKWEPSSLAAARGNASRRLRNDKTRQQGALNFVS